MEKILAKVTDSYGEETPTAVLIQEDGLGEDREEKYDNMEMP